MKLKSLSILAGVGAPLILSGSADAGFLGIKVEAKENQFGLFVVNVFAVFDRPGEDFMLAVAGTPNAPMDIRVKEGTFFQHDFGSDQAPLGAAIDLFPLLAYDTFVTIGVKQVGPGGGNPGQPNDALGLTPGWPGFGPSSLKGTELGWFLLPDDPQGDPFDPNYFPGNGQVLIGQFATADGTGIMGTMLLQYISNGDFGETVVSFDLQVPAPGAFALLAVAGLLGTGRRRRQ